MVNFSSVHCYSGTSPIIVMNWQSHHFGEQLIIEQNICSFWINILFTITYSDILDLNKIIEQKLFILNEIVIHFESYTYALIISYLNNVKCSLEQRHNVFKYSILLLRFEHLGTFKETALYLSIWRNEMALIPKFIYLQ